MYYKNEHLVNATFPIIIHYRRGVRMRAGMCLFCRLIYT